jgi:TonB family protein
MRLALFSLFTFICLAVIKADAQPIFKGGTTALDNFLSNNIVYPEYARQNCIPGVIKVRFRVDSLGKVTEAAVLDGMGIDLDDEAVRVIKVTSGHWQVPADYNTNSNIILPIRFVPDNARCTNATKASIAAAIDNYRSQQELQNAVINYYKNRDPATVDTNKEAQIIALKKQLGYDDDFINDVLDQADKKLKQGDKAGACETWNFIHNIGSNKADSFIAKYCSSK